MTIPNTDDGMRAVAETNSMLRLLGLKALEAIAASGTDITTEEGRGRAIGAILCVGQIALNAGLSAHRRGGAEGIPDELGKWVVLRNGADLRESFDKALNPTTERNPS